MRYSYLDVFTTNHGLIQGLNPHEYMSDDGVVIFMTNDIV